MTVLGRNTTIRIDRPARVADSIGDLDSTYINIATGIKARIEPQNTGQSEVDRQDQGRETIADYWGLLDGDQTALVRSQDVVTDEIEGERYFVVDVHRLGRRTTRNHHTELELRKIEAQRNGSDIPLTVTP